MKKRLSLLILIMVITLTMTAFSDLDEKSDTTPYIQEFHERGLIFGYLDGSFRPEASITRSEFVALINRTFGYTETVDVEILFFDVEPGAWYTKDLQIAISKGYIKGFVDNTFRPLRNITRHEVAVVINRILQHETIQYHELEDEVESWAREDVYALLSAGILSTTKGRFNGAEAMTREDVVVSLLTVLHQKEAKELLLQEEQENDALEGSVIDELVTPVIQEEGNNAPLDQDEENNTPPNQEKEIKVPPADVIYAMNMTISGLEKIQLQQNKYSQALDANQLGIIGKIKSNMQSYLADYAYNYEEQARLVNVDYKNLSEEEQNELKNAIGYHVAYQYLSTIEKYFEKG